MGIPGRWTYEMSQLPAREVNGQYVVSSVTSPVTGEIVDAHYSWSRTYLQKSVPHDNYSTGNPTELECQILS